MFRNLPNLLTILRLVLVPFVVRTLWAAHYRRSILLLFIAGATDALDGYLARRFAWTSRFGAYLDPIGDKVLIISVYLTLGLRGAIPQWLTWLVLGRDAIILAMVLLALLITPIRSFPPSIWGKISTVVQVGAALTIIIANAYFPSRPLTFDRSVILATALATAWSGFNYVWTAAHQLRTCLQSES